MLRQYRHPVRHKLWEIPAGLLDVPGENPLHAAQRELYEEAHVKAGDWRVLADVYTSPGGSDEARADLPGPRRVRGGGRALRGRRGGGRHGARPGAAGRPGRGVLAGELHNNCLVVGVLALQAALAGDGLDALRPAEAPWPARPFTA